MLYDGTRGPGKTDALLMKFAQHCGRGWGSAWRGVLFRCEYKDLAEIETKSKRFFNQLPREVRPRFLNSKAEYKWVWKTGEELLLRAVKHPDDYWGYHGHEYPFIGFDELTSWPTDELYEMLKSCSRSSIEGMPRFYVATTNPYGAGHGWVKLYWIDPEPQSSPMGVFILDDQSPQVRVRITGDILENEHLLRATPEYLARLEAIKDENRRRAWRFGDWTIQIGAFFEGSWDPDRNLVQPFTPPYTWPRWRAFDWGFARPYSVGWYCMDNDGVIYRYRELYGWNGKPDHGARHTNVHVAHLIAQAERHERRAGLEFRNNPADHNLWNTQGYERDMAEDYLNYRDPETGERIPIRWVRAMKGPLSRVNGWNVCRQMMQTGQFKVATNCRHFLRTVPILLPDEDDWEDIDTEQEDHVADEMRYSLVSRHRPHRAPTRSRLPTAPKAGTFDAIAADPPKPRNPYRMTRRRLP